MQVLKLFVALLLYFSKPKAVLGGACAGSGTGSCAYGGAIPYGTDKCLVITANTDTWSGQYGECFGIAQFDFGNPMSYGRLAVFTDNDQYYKAINNINSASGPKTVWLGAQAVVATHPSLADYCWMTNENTPGSQVGRDTIPVKIGKAGKDYCLYINTSTPGTFYADGCSETHFGICEIGCPSTSEPDATCPGSNGENRKCALGNCGIQSDSVSTTTVTITTTKETTLTTTAVNPTMPTMPTMPAMPTTLGSTLTSKTSSITATSTTSLTKTTRSRLRRAAPARQLASSTATTDTAANASSECPISTLCASFDGILGSDGKCYVLFKNETSWDIGQQNCGKNNFADGNRPVYGRTAVFTDSAIYYNVISQINATEGATYAWIGAQARNNTNPLYLLNFCWMTDQAIFGSQMTLQQTWVQRKTNISPVCLYIFTGNPYSYSYTADSCGKIAYYYTICEFGCTKSKPDVTCASGQPKTIAACSGADACNFSALATPALALVQASVSTSTTPTFTASVATSDGSTSIITTKTTTAITTTSNVPSTTAIATTSTVSSATPTTSGSITTSLENTPSSTVTNLLTLPLSTQGSSSLTDSNQATTTPPFSLSVASTPLSSLSLQPMSTVATEFTSQLSQSEAPSTASSTFIALVSAQSSSGETPVSLFQATTAISPSISTNSSASTTPAQSSESVQKTSSKTQELTSRSSSAEQTSALSPYSSLLSTTVSMTPPTSVLAGITGQLSSTVAATFSQISVTDATLEAVTSFASTSAVSRPTSIASAMLTTAQNELLSSSASPPEVTVTTSTATALASLAQSLTQDTTSSLIHLSSDLPFTATVSPTSLLAPSTSATDLFSSSFRSYALTLTQKDSSSTQDFLAPSTVDESQPASTTKIFTPEESNNLNTKTPALLPLVALLESPSPNQLEEATLSPLYGSNVQSTTNFFISRVTSLSENVSKGITIPEITSNTIVNKMQTLPSDIFAFSASTRQEMTLTTPIVAKSSQSSKIRKQSTSYWLKLTKSSFPTSFPSQQAMTSDAALVSLETGNTGTNVAAISASYLTNVATGSQSETSNFTLPNDLMSIQTDETSADPETADLVLIATGSKVDQNITTQSSPSTNSIRKKKTAFTNEAAFASKVTASDVSNAFATYNAAVLSESQYLTTKTLQNTLSIQEEVKSNTSVQNNLALTKEQYALTSANTQALFANTVPDFLSTVASSPASNNADRSDITNFNDTRSVLIGDVTDQGIEVVDDASTDAAIKASNNLTMTSLANTKEKEKETDFATRKQTITLLTDNAVSNKFTNNDANLSQNQILTTSHGQISFDSQSQSQDEINLMPNNEQSTFYGNIAQSSLPEDLLFLSNTVNANANTVDDLANQVATNNPLDNLKTPLPQNYKPDVAMQNAAAMYSIATAAILYANQNQSQIENPFLSSSTVDVDPETQNSIRESDATQSNNSQLDELKNLAVTENSKNEQSQIANKAESEQSNNLTSSDNDNYSNLDIYVPDLIAADNPNLQQGAGINQPNNSPLQTNDTLQQIQNLISDKSSITDDKATDETKAKDAAASQSKGTESIKQNSEQDSNVKQTSTIQSNQLQNSVLTASPELKDAQQNREASSTAAEIGDPNSMSNDNPASALPDMNLENDLTLSSNTATLQADQSQFQTNTTLEQVQNPVYDNSSKTTVDDNTLSNDNNYKDNSSSGNSLDIDKDSSNLSDNAKQNENQNAWSTEQNKTIFSIPNADHEATSQTSVNKLGFSNGYTNPGDGNSVNKNVSNDDKRKAQETGASSDCDLLDWGPYSSCSATCGVNAVRVRQRKVDNLTSGIKNKCPTEEASQCNVPKCNPMTQTELLVSSIEMNIGCCWLMSTLVLSFIAAIIRRSKTYMSIVHASENISMLLSHIIVMVFAMRDDNKFNHDVCKVAAIGLQYFYVVSFGFQFMEALYIYSVLTSVSVGNDLLIGIKMTMGLCWGIPVVVTGFTAAFAYDHLMSDFTCWLNLGDHVFLATFLPVLALACPTAILLEAAGKEVRGASPANVISCRIARGSLALVFSSHFASWFLGSSALYYQRISLFTIVFGFNVTTGILIFFYHLFSDTKVRTLGKRICCRNTEKIGPKLVLR